MLQKKELLSLGFYKKSPFTGSLGTLRYRLEKSDVPEETPLGPYVPEETQKEDVSDGDAPSDEIPMKTVLLLTIWPGPYAFDTTSDELKKKAIFEFSEEGLSAVTDFLNGKAAEMNGK
ncbi:MAG: hypothetical protein VZQ80_05720 [Lachnospiraceae bacterium]|nr:hypothetical protein [Lachnospiraceae bacterium]